MSKASKAMMIGLLLASVSALMPAAWDASKGLYAIFSVLEEKTFDNTTSFFIDNYLDVFAVFSYLVLFFATALVGYFWESNAEARIQLKEQELADKTSELVKNSEFMVNALQTLPPKHYLANFQETYVEVRKLTIGTKELSSILKTSEMPTESHVIEKVEHWIGSMLSQLAKLTKDWDTQGTALDNSVEYRVNIMRYYPAKKALEKFKNQEYSWEDSERFFMASAPEGIVSDIDGVLFADKILCACRYGDGSTEVIAPNRPIALPVTIEESKFYDQNLPGAPQAFAAAQALYIENCKSIIHSKIDKVKHISDYMRKQLREYYGEGNFAQSIISFPLLDNFDNQYGVINVYRNKSDLAKRNSHDFMALMRPVVETISESVLELYSLRDAMSGTERDNGFEKYKIYYVSSNQCDKDTRDEE